MISSFDPIKNYVVKVVCIEQGMTGIRDNTLLQIKITNGTHKYEGNISHNNFHGKFSVLINSKRIYQKKIIN